VSKTFDASLIAQANSFEHTSVPEPVFKREEFDEKMPIATPTMFSPKLSDGSPWVFPRQTKGRFSSTTTTDLTQLNLLFFYCRNNITGIIATRQPAAASKDSLASLYSCPLNPSLLGIYMYDLYDSHDALNKYSCLTNGISQRTRIPEQYRKN